MSVTLQEISRQAKVSKSAVSAVLSGASGGSGTRVGAATRARIQEVAKRMGYRPNVLAKGLRGGRTQTIGILWSFGSAEPKMKVPNAIAMQAQKHGYLAQLANHLTDPDLALRYLQDFRQRGVDAVIFQDGERGSLQSPEILALLREFAAALVVSPTRVRDVGGAPMDVIEHDRLAACREVADHFAAIGRRRPGILTFLGANQGKTEAFLDRCESKGLQVGPNSRIAMERRRERRVTEDYWHMLESRFGAGEPFAFDALFCSTDEGAAVAVDWLGRRGLRVPREVAVVGFNDESIGRHFSPPLASVERRDDEVAAAIERLLFARLADAGRPPERELIPMRFIWRESAGSRPQDVQQTVREADPTREQ